RTAGVLPSLEPEHADRQADAADVPEHIQGGAAPGRSRNAARVETGLAPSPIARWRWAVDWHGRPESFQLGHGYGEHELAFGVGVVDNADYGRLTDGRDRARVDVELTQERHGGLVFLFRVGEVAEFGAHLQLQRVAALNHPRPDVGAHVDVGDCAFLALHRNLRADFDFVRSRETGYQVHGVMPGVDGLAAFGLVEGKVDAKCGGCFLRVVGGGFHGCGFLGRGNLSAPEGRA